jgi:hypothetical protein
MASYKLLPIRKPAPACPTNGTKANSTALNSASSTTRTPLMSHRLDTPSTTARSQTSTFQWAMGCIKRPSGSASTTMGPSWDIIVHRGPTSSPTSSVYMQHLTTVSTPPSGHSHPGSNTCLPAPVGTSRSYSKPWLTQMIGAWPARSCAIANSMTTSRQWQSRLSSTSVTSTPFKCSLDHVSLASCLPVPLNESPHYKTY